MTQDEFSKTIEQLKEVVQGGDTDAMRMLGDLYYQGVSGNELNLAAARPYWKMAADRGDLICALKIGLDLLQHGEETAGFQYVLKSANAGHADAQYWVGLCYLDDLGTGKSPSEGISFLRKAALNNHADAQLSLGQALVNNRGDLMEATHWLCCAHLNGNKTATDKLKAFVESLDGADTFVEHRIEYIKEYGITPPNSNGLPSTQSTNSEGCYIATAVYGSYDAPEVIILRRFRDNILRKHWWGRLFIKAYYYLSPTAAQKLKSADRINYRIRQVLDRIVTYLSTKFNNP